MSGDDGFTAAVTLRSVGDQVQDGVYTIHSHYATCLNLQDHAKLISCTRKSDWAGPIQIILHGLDLHRIERIVIQDRQMTVNQADCFAISEQVIFDSGLDVPESAAAVLEKNSALASAALLELAHAQSLAFIFDPRRTRHFTSAFDAAFCRRVLAGVAAMRQGDVLGGLASLKGVGFGLTPSGDDFIAGCLYGLYLLQQIHRSDLSALRATIYARTRGGNLLSNTFLDLASQGRFSEKLKGFIGALCNNEPSRLIPAMKQVMAMGSTSGADLLCGLFFALRTLKDRLLNYRKEDQQELNIFADPPSCSSL